MKAGHIKGALLEYIVRQLLKSCGFTNVTADNIFTFERGGLFFLNGKGAAHDADVIMNPPIQMPFAYPTQLIFECKAFSSKVGLTIVRNALGLRNDLNDFEIVTKNSLIARQNNRRAYFAVDNRTRYIYQVGVASINEFSKPAIEFATNNKIPLLSLSWFLSPNLIKDLNNITQALVNKFEVDLIEILYKFLKDRDGKLDLQEYNNVNQLLNEDNVFGDIITYSNTVIKYSYVGLLETGDLVFLIARSGTEKNILDINTGFKTYKALIHWAIDSPDVWRLTIYEKENPDFRTEFDFYLPKRIYEHWMRFNMDKSAAIDIKQEFFSKIFVFNNKNNNVTPFSIITLDKLWFNRYRDNLNE